MQADHAGPGSDVSLCFQLPSFLISALACRRHRAVGPLGLDMSKAPPAPPSLAVLRKEIDAIDEQAHQLLMARGDIIDRLIQVKEAQKGRSAVRSARDAGIMRPLGARH